MRGLDGIAWVRALEPVRPAGLSLLLTRTIIDALPYGFDVGVTAGGSEPVFLEPVPFCGCDACDDGSVRLLEELDGCVLTVASGGVVHARATDPLHPSYATDPRGTTATRRWDGGRGDQAWLDETGRLRPGWCAGRARRGVSGHRRVSGPHGDLGVG